MKRIVVGADGSADSVRAMRWAGRLAQGTDTEVVVMTGFAPPTSQLRERGIERLLAEQRQQLESYADAAQLDAAAVRIVVEDGDPRQGILMVAERENADLVAVGRVGHSAGPGKFNIGSMAEWLAHHSTLPLGVINAPSAGRAPSVLLAVDGSSGSRAAAAWMTDYARLTGAVVYAASVAHHLVEWTTSSSLKNWRRQLERQICDDFASAATADGVDVIPVALDGSSVSRSLLDAATAHGVDTIVAGTTGLSDFAGRRLGGVAMKLLHDAPRNIVLVPEPTF